jgi:hypothetical protein
VLLADLAQAFSGERVSIGDILDNLQGRAVGVVLLLLALPMCIPNVPGISTIFGLLILAPAFQLILGSNHLWMPRRVRAWTVPREALNGAIKGSLPTLRKIEQHIRPRWRVFIRPPFAQLLGLQTLLMALVLMLPIPGGNWPPGMTVAATGLALAQRDGRLALATAPLAAVSVGIAYFGYRIGVAVLREGVHILHQLFNGVWPA